MDDVDGSALRHRRGADTVQRPDCYCAELDLRTGFRCAVLIVVPAQKRRHPATRILIAGEWTAGLVRSVLHYVDQRLGVGVVFANLGLENDLSTPSFRPCWPLWPPAEAPDGALRAARRLAWLWACSTRWKLRSEP